MKNDLKDAFVHLDFDWMHFLLSNIQIWRLLNCILTSKIRTQVKSIYIKTHYNGIISFSKYSIEITDADVDLISHKFYI